MPTEAIGVKWIKGRKAGIKLRNIALRFQGQLHDEVVRGALDIRNEMIRSMRDTSKTGKRYKRGKKWHVASSPGKPPAIDTGQLIRSITMDDRLDEIEVGVTSGAPYAPFLETGTKKMKERPFMKPAIDKEMPKVMFRVRQIVRKLQRDMKK